MPEWPEMETYRKMLAERISGQPITKVEVNREKSINVSPEAFHESLIGKTVLFVERRGKMLLFHLDDGKRLLLHLMLGGLIHFGPPGERPDRSVQVALEFPSGELSFIGLRLGYLHLYKVKEVEAHLEKLGPDPLDKRLTLEQFRKRFAGKRGSLKTALVNQQVVSGIGNCYADEIVFDAGVRPDARISDLEPETWEKLYHSMHKVLLNAASLGGYMEMPMTADDTLTGGYNDHCLVYDRGGEPCIRCGGTVEQGEINSRKMFYCPSCQKDR
ncbi:Fpg/Nei family DNA glycosylase [Paenibacillus nasutitermitis]|uniref:Formamidopyrimidine-DNA glycosylase n=1 Tax=Paenibacillus nasutitermitis TaxID=1652958 RepID=A0A917DS83_9BACL|nr:Fpg/Nei family DNA glycosylase [Paenibacillus nasutitermitis]GGD63860.1 DNA-formamidopyrimidine glycosylase [Paenibacillus nasutitermitis]